MNYTTPTNRRILIGEGRTAKVYLQDGYAFKCFHQTHPLDWIIYEVNIQNEVASKTILPVLLYTYEENTNEIKMPYINGIELTQRIRKNKYKQGLEDLVHLQQEVYAYENLNLPHAHDVFKHTIQISNLTEQLKHDALDALASIEQKNVLCHFDFHFSNIMFAGKKYFIIDWVNAKLGNPVLDIARTYVILVQYAYRLSNKYLKMIAKELNIPLSLFEKPIKLMAILRSLELSDEEVPQRVVDLIK